MPIRTVEVYDSWTGRLLNVKFELSDISEYLISHGMSYISARGMQKGIYWDERMGLDSHVGRKIEYILSKFLGRKYEQNRNGSRISKKESL